MKKLKVFFALLISLALMLTLCCAASAEDEPAWALSMDGDTLTCLDNYYVRLNTAQFGVDIGEVIYKTESLAVYSVRGDTSGHLVWMVDREHMWPAGLFCLVDAKDEVSGKLLNFEPSDRFVTSQFSEYPITQDVGEGVIAELCAAEGERVEYAELGMSYYWYNQIYVYDSTGLVRTVVGSIFEDENNNYYYADYTTVEGTYFNYSGAPIEAFGSTIKLVQLTNEQFEALELGEDEEYVARREEYEAVMYNRNENIIVDDSSAADAIALVMSLLLFLVLPLAMLIIGIIGAIRSRRYRVFFIVAAALSVIILAAYVTILVLIL